MAGDGVSLQTNLTQLGSVAKTQTRAQQTGTAGAGHTQQLDKEDAKPLETVRETEKAEKKTIDSEEERKNQRRRRGKTKSSAAEDDAEDLEDDDDVHEPGLGGLVDLKA